MLFSIITVCFNSAKTIRQTFDSVLQQEFKDYEYIVVDGASTDGTVDIIREYEPKFEGRMRWISEPDKGIYDAMNKGIRMSQGDYLNFLNTGDYYESDTLRIIMEKIQYVPGFDVYYGITRVFDENGERVLERIHHRRLKDIWTINHQAIWYHRKKCFSAFGVYRTEFSICADYEHLLRLFEGGCSFLPIDQIVVNYSFYGTSEFARYSGEMDLQKEQIKVLHGYISKDAYDKTLKVRKWEKRKTRFIQSIYQMLLLHHLMKIIKKIMWGI